MIGSLASWKPKGLRLQWIAGSIVSLITFGHGLSSGWFSPYLAKFLSGDSPFPATQSEIDLMVSIQQFGRIPGSVSGAIFVQYFGAKTSLLTSGSVMLINWILIIFANSVTWIYVARFTCGATVQITAIAFPLYLADISGPNIRGALVAMSTNGLMIGTLIGSAMGPYLSMKIYACLALIPNIIFLLTFYWIPNSPYYLTSIGRKKDAENSILSYNPKARLSIELDSIEKFLSLKNSTSFKDRLIELNLPRNRNYAIIMIILCMLVSFSGVNLIYPYMESILIKGKVNVVDPGIVPIIGNSVGLISGWIMMYFADKFGRKIMWIVSSAGICGSMITLGIYFHLINNEFELTIFQWIPIASILLFQIFFNLGLNCVTAILVSELFASNIRTLASWISAVSSAAFGFASVEVDQFISNNVNESYVYWTHAVLMFVSLIFGCLFIPEMKGETLLQIQEKLKSKDVR